MRLELELRMSIVNDSKKKTPLQKACEWLNVKTNYTYIPVVANRKGYAEFVAYVFKLPREGKLTVWYVLEMASQYEPKSVKRICRY